MACITPTDTDALIPQELFTPQGDSALSALTSTPSRQSPAAKSKGTHSFTLVARMLEDPALAPGVACAGAARGEGPYFETLENTGALIQKYGAEWCVDGTDAESVREKVEELSWLITLLYGVGGLQPDKAFHADFYTYVRRAAPLHRAPSADGVTLNKDAPRHVFALPALLPEVPQRVRAEPFSAYVSHLHPRHLGLAWPASTLRLKPLRARVRASLAARPCVPART